MMKTIWQKIERIILALSFTQKKVEGHEKRIKKLEDKK